jgi:hypothetical protein
MASEVERDGASELPWLAFRYVSGEMAGDEAAAFEDRLDQDQEAREAVAQAVELVGAVAALRPGEGEQTLSLWERGLAAAPPSATASARPGEGRRAARRHHLATFAATVTMAAAACLAWLAFNMSGPAPVPPGTPRAAAITPAAAVALTWSTLDQERATDKGESSALLAWNDDVPTPAESEDTSELGLPPWLVDAASLASRPERAGVPAKDL